MGSTGKFLVFEIHIISWCKNLQSRNYVTLHKIATNQIGTQLEFVISFIRIQSYLIFVMRILFNPKNYVKHKQL